MAGRNMRIGYVDYNLENFHANVYLKALRNELKDRGATIAGCIGMLEEEGREWAQKNEVPWFDSMEELNKNVDAYMILAPSNPEVHPELAEWTFKFGKPTYVDKTFAPDAATAQKIFDLADKHGTSIQTTSALRYTAAQKYVAEAGADKVRHMVTWGGGRSFGEYSIHPTEIIVSCMGAEAESLMRRGTGDEGQLLVNYSGGRTAVINVYANTKTPFAASVTTTEATAIIPIDGSRIFIDTADAVLDFLDSGEPNIPRAESMAVMRILEAARDPNALKGFIRV